MRIRLGLRGGLGVAVGLALAIAAVSQIIRPTVGPWSNPTPEERDALVEAVRAANAAKGIAARTFDMSVVRASFTDDERVPLTARQRETLGRIAPGTVPAGLLTFQLAFFEHWRRGAEAADRIFAARTAGRTADPSDLAGALPRRTDPMYELPMSVVLVKVSGEYGYVEADTGAEYQRVTLVRRGGLWRVAGEDNTPRT